jgi:hypothetical protein
MIICQNCGAEGDQKYCPGCGQALQAHRISMHTLLHEVAHIFWQTIFFTNIIFLGQAAMLPFFAPISYILFNSRDLPFYPILPGSFYDLSAQAEP